MILNNTNFKGKILKMKNQMVFIAVLQLKSKKMETNIPWIYSE